MFFSEAKRRYSNTENTINFDTHSRSIGTFSTTIEERILFSWCNRSIIFFMDFNHYQKKYYSLTIKLRVLQNTHRLQNPHSDSQPSNYNYRYRFCAAALNAKAQKPVQGRKGTEI